MWGALEGLPVFLIALVFCLLLLGVPSLAGEAPAQRPGRGGSIWRAVPTIQVEDRGFLQLESGNVPKVLPQPRGVPEHSSG